MMVMMICCLPPVVAACSTCSSSAETTAVGILVLLLGVVIDPHLGDGRVADLGRGGIVPLRMLGGGVGVEEPLLAFAEDAFLRCVLCGGIWIPNKVRRGCRGFETKKEGDW